MQCKILRFFLSILHKRVSHERRRKNLEISFNHHHPSNTSPPVNPTTPLTTLINAASILTSIKQYQYQCHHLQAMVLPANAWLSANSNYANKTTLSRFNWFHRSPSSQETLQILCFETAKTMSRLIALYRFISGDEVWNLRKGVMKSRGVSYLNSDDESFLLNLACLEKLEDLDSAASNVSRLGRKCLDYNLQHFGEVFENLKRGDINIERPEFSSRYADKIVKKMEKYVSATSNLHAALESLAEMESSERKVQLWKTNLDPKLPQKPNATPFQEKIAFQRKQVKRLQEISLWSHTFDNSLTLMAKIVFVIYTRICDLFSPFVLGLHCGQLQILSVSKPLPIKVRPDFNPSTVAEENNFVPIRKFMPCSILKSLKKLSPKRFYSQALASTKLGNANVPLKMEKTRRVAQLAPPSTVGGAGLALRYANIIILAESCLYSLMDLRYDERDFMYEMLPARIKETIRRKLKGRWDKEGEGHELAEQCREALEEILGWLAPMAHDTVQWQTEKNLEKQRFDLKPNVLLLQTLHFSDLEKTEAAMVEVLVGLSCIYWYENPQRAHGGSNGGGGGECLYR